MSFIFVIFDQIDFIKKEGKEDGSCVVYAPLDRYVGPYLDRYIGRYVSRHID